MKKKLFIGFILMSGVALMGAYFFIVPPKTVSIMPLNKAQDVALHSSLVIKFDKPIKRQMVSHTITPEIHGEWKFEDSLIKNHLLKTLIFTPAVDFEQNTQYKVEVKNVVSPLGVGLSNDFSFSFKTQEISSKKISQIETSLAIEAEPKVTLLYIDLDWQDQPLSCEAASLKMALAGKGVHVSENDIMEKIGYDQTPHQGNIWGDPNKAFVGNIDGKMVDTGYGVHWEPVANAAKNWREAESFSNWDLKNLIREIELGNPVIVWGTLPVKILHDYFWYTLEGTYIKTFRETHVRLVVGFVGEAESPSSIILNDPLSGRLYWPTSYFLINWKNFGNSGVVLR